jgi:transposase
MPRIAVRIEVSAEEKAQLEKMTSGRVVPKYLSHRATIILDCARGKENREIAKELAICEQTVAKWRRRFTAKRLAGLEDAPRNKPPRKYGRDLRDRILQTLEMAPPKGFSSWDGGSLAKHLSVPKHAVWNILRKEGIQLQRKRSWCVSTDKQFGAKSADVIGLYLNPPENALVICVDEKPSIQALERARGYVETSNGKIVQGLKSTYKRHGTLNLFAALNVATGQIKAKTTDMKKRKDFQAFLEEVVADVPADREVHVILDNYCTHKRNENWLAKHPNVFFHFTPTSASWLNQVEIWFGILSRKALRGASFNSKESLSQAIHDFIEVYHEGAKPFVWKKREVKGSQLRNTLTNLAN